MSEPVMFRTVPGMRTAEYMHDAVIQWTALQVAKARKKGLLVPGPCEVCGRTDKVEGHHDDYSDPLKVRWLCRKDHKALHERLRRERLARMTA